MSTVGMADLAFVNGAVYTVDAVRSWAGAVAVRDGRITAVGTDAEIREQVAAGAIRLGRAHEVAGALEQLGGRLEAGARRVHLGGFLEPAGRLELLRRVFVLAALLVIARA